MTPITLNTSTAAETVALGQRLASFLRLGDVLALTGPLGAGKTQLTRGIAQGLAVDSRQVASPTFILMSEYEGPVPLVHIDAYRIHTLHDLESIGFTAELLYRSITVIEWADRITPDLPHDHLRIDLAHTEGGREITVTPHGDFSARFDGIRRALSENPRSDAAPTLPRTSPNLKSTCRNCGKATTESSTHSPFCSDRCRLADLNKWFTARYSVSRPLSEDDVGSQLP